MHSRHSTVSDGQSGHTEAKDIGSWGAPECPAYVGQRLQLTEAMRPRVAIALYGDLTHDGRVQREAASLANAGYRVTVLALAAGDVSPEFEDDIEYLAWSPGATAVLPGTWSPFYPENPGTKQGRLAGQRLGWFAGYVANLRAWGRWAVHSGGAGDGLARSRFYGSRRIGPRASAAFSAPHLRQSRVVPGIRNGCTTAPTSTLAAQTSRGATGSSGRRCHNGQPIDRR